VLRTGELAALHRFDGAEQYFTRAVDFGYSFSIDETFEKCGRQEITADYVRLIRTIRPDVIVTLPPTGNAGGQHHMASAVITRDAYKLAADPTKFPEQIKEGLRPWQPKKLYHLAAFGFPGEPPPTGRVTRVNTSVYDPLLGKTYNDIGTEARSMHKCQGMGPLRTLPIDDAGKYEIDFRLRQKEGEFQSAALLAAGVKVEALADDGVVVPGQPVKVNVIIANYGAPDVAVKQVHFDGFEGETSCS